MSGLQNASRVSERGSWLRRGTRAGTGCWRAAPASRCRCRSPGPSPRAGASSTRATAPTPRPTPSTRLGRTYWCSRRRRADWRSRVRARRARRTSRSASSTRRASRSSPRVPSASSASSAATGSATPSPPDRTCSRSEWKPRGSGPCRSRRWRRATARAKFASRPRWLAGTRFTCGAGTSATPSGARRSTSTSSPGRLRVHRASRSSRGPSWRGQESSPPSPANPSRFACKRGTGSATPPRGSAGRPSASPRPARRTWCSPRRWSRTMLMLTWATGAHPDAASSPPCCTEPERTSCGAPWAAKPSWDGHVSSRWYPGRPRRTRRSGARRLRPWRSPRRSRPTALAVIR